MPWNIFDYRDTNGRNLVRRWLQGAGVNLRAKADAKIKILQLMGPNAPPNLLADTKERNVKKLRLLGTDNTRILCCRGPVDFQGEYTLLAAYPEKDSRLPAGAESTCAKYRANVIANPQAHREQHEFEK